ERRCGRSARRAAAAVRRPSSGGWAPARPRRSRRCAAARPPRAPGTPSPRAASAIARAAAPGAARRPARCVRNVPGQGPPRHSLRSAPDHRAERDPHGAAAIGDARHDQGAFGLDQSIVERLAGQRRDELRVGRRGISGPTGYPDRFGRPDRARAAEAGELALALEELRGARCGIAEIHPVPGGKLELVRTRLELGLEQQLLLLERNDLTLGTDDLAAHRVHLEMQHQVERGADRQRGDPADAANAALRGHAASLDGAAVRIAARKVALRARGLRSVSASDGRIAFDTRSNVAARPARASGKWRLARAVAPDASRRKRFTMRSSRLWKLTTASRPPVLSRRSAATRPSSSSPSSPLTWIRIAWKLRVAGSLG